MKWTKLQNKVYDYVMGDTVRKENFADIEICSEQDNEEANEIIVNIVSEMSDENCIKYLTEEDNMSRIDDNYDAINLEIAKKYIADFNEMEYYSKTDFSDLKNIGIAYTTLGDEEYEFQVFANLVNPSINYVINGKLVRTDVYDDLADMIEKELSFLEFDYFLSEAYKEVEKIIINELE